MQHTNQIRTPEKLEGRYNLTIEMESSVGKTYTYIKTMYELNKHYDWSKFIAVVRIAIHKGVYSDTGAFYSGIRQEDSFLYLY